MAAISFSGLASGIDSTALIEATTAATRKQRVTPKQTKIDELTATNTSLDELETKLRTLKTAAETMGSLAGGAVAKTGTSSNETIATATVTNGALNGSYSLTTTQLAKSASYSFDYAYTGGNDTVASLGANDTISFVFGTSSPENVDIEVTPTMTLNDFVTAFNAESTRAEASIIQVGPNDYRLLITTAETGESAGEIVSVTRGVGFAGGKLDPGDVTHDPAQNAIFTLNGIGPFTRQKNDVNDVISGVTFNLLDAPGTANISIANDPASSATIVKKFIDAYNEVIKYVNENDTITSKQEGSEFTNVFGPLASTRTDDAAISTLKEAIASIAFASGTAIAILPDLGIETDGTLRDGSLKFDEAKFKTALSTDPTAVNKITMQLGDKLGYSYKANLGTGLIDSLIRFNGIFDTTVNGNKTLIDSLNDQIATAEAAIAQTEANMKAQFARLESTVSKLQSQQQSLTSALAGLK